MSFQSYQRPQLTQLSDRLLKESRRFIQVVYGPRQVGKTTLVDQFLTQSGYLHHYASADAVAAADPLWVAHQWENARLIAARHTGRDVILALDEIQKVGNWSEQVKKEWDRDTRERRNVKVILLGSSRLLLQQGLTESLAGRFETLYLGHWSYPEMHQAFGFSPQQYVWFGGYPGAAALVDDEPRWQQYVLDSLIEATVSKDILMLTRVDKPALIKRLFELGCVWSGQVLSFNKILGQLLDAGNTTTLAHYLTLLDAAGLLAGLPKYSPGIIRQRASSPKFQVHNTALMSAQSGESFKGVAGDPLRWGRWVESAVGAHLLNLSLSRRFKLYYWRQGNNEVDFVAQIGNKVVGIEVKSGWSKKRSGLVAFQRGFQPDHTLLIGESGISWEEFLSMESFPDG